MSEKQLLPHNDEAERALLGGILIDPDAYYEAAHLLTADMFFSGKHGSIYKAIADTLRAGMPLDVVTLGEVLESRNVCNVEYITGLMVTVPTSSHVAAYAKQVAALATRRGLIHASFAISQAAHDVSVNVDTAVQRSEAALFAVTDQISTADVEPIRAGMSSLYDLTMQYHANGGQATGLPTGFVDLDRLLDGLHRSDLIVLAGRPGMGKSALEGAIALHVAKNGKRVARFNLEMPAVQSWQRMVSIETGIPLKRLRRGQLNENEIPLFAETVGRLSEYKMWLDDTPALTPTQLAARCRRLYAECGLDLITVDHLQLMAGDGTAGNRTQEVGQISRALKALAKNLDVPVLALAQLSRSCEMRADKRPQLSDLRDSGEIEQDSDVVMFMYRDEYYNRDASDRPNVAEVNIAKHRNGELGSVDLYFDKQRVRFGNIEKREIVL